MQHEVSTGVSDSAEGGVQLSHAEIAFEVEDNPCPARTGYQTDVGISPADGKGLVDLLGKCDHLTKTAPVHSRRDVDQETQINLGSCKNTRIQR